ncbi:MAG: ABC transporter substrate-binding protein, partial [Symploca sp. SIO1B1]|nr:ABC transporter substrate-binding protein [Symploca sp. SIO1B1]
LFPGAKFSEFIEQILLTKLSQNTVVLLDEIDSVLSLSFPIDEFFEIIQTCYNQRADNPEYRRLTFALFGVATPKELIQDKTHTLFNIGRAIELHGFEPIEAEHLELGLKEKVRRPRAALKTVLDWTNGQPFLTNKICQLIQTLPSPIPEGEEAQRITNLIKSQIINNWEKQDIPEHLQTIRDQIMGRQQGTSLLELYRQILVQHELEADDSSLEHLELRLSGLVIKNGTRLRVNNKIYSSVFNSNWINETIESIRPYAIFLDAWLASNCQDTSKLIKGAELKESLKWAFRKDLNNEEAEFLNASIKLDYREEIKLAQEEIKKALEAQQKQQAQEEKQAQMQNYNKRWKMLTIATAVLSVTCVPFMSYYLSQDKMTADSSSEPSLLDNFSSGERPLFTSKEDAFKSGIEAFQRRDYGKAIEYFGQATQNDPDDPIPRIFLNNAKARDRGSHFTLAVVVPQNDITIAKEILRGVSDAQDDFNQNASINGGKLLEITIVEEQDQAEEKSRQVKSLVDNKAVLGVIGHSPTSEVLTEYENYGVAVVSPTNGNNSLLETYSFFFQTTLSHRAIAKKLANHLHQTLDLNQVAIFYDSQNSNNLKQAFEEEFKDLGGQVLNTVDLTKSKLELQSEIKRTVNNQVDAAVLLPSTNTNDKAIAIARENAKLPPEAKLKLFGSHEMYKPETLIKGGSIVEGLILAVPWVDDTSYGKAAKEKWRGKVSWRTATSYDATKALINAINPEDVNRENVLEALKDIEVAANGTSGEQLKFSAAGERAGEAHLVVVDRDAAAPRGAEFGFQPLE